MTQEERENIVKELEEISCLHKKIELATSLEENLLEEYKMHLSEITDRIIEDNPSEDINFTDYADGEITPIAEYPLELYYFHSTPRQKEKIIAKIALFVFFSFFVSLLFSFLVPSFFIVTVPLLLVVVFFSVPTINDKGYYAESNNEWNDTKVKIIENYEVLEESFEVKSIEYDNWIAEKNAEIEQKKKALIKKREALFEEKSANLSKEFEEKAKEISREKAKLLEEGEKITLIPMELFPFAEKIGKALKLHRADSLKEAINLSYKE